MLKDTISALTGSSSRVSTAPAGRRRVGGQDETARKIRVYIVADNATEARQMTAQLNAHSDITVIGYSTTAAELQTALHLRLDIDVLITDVVLEGRRTDTFVHEAVERLPNLNVLCYTLRSDEATVIRAIQSGVTGYILRDSQEDLANCVRLLQGGGSPVSPIVARSVIRALHGRAPQHETAPHADAQGLSAREREILQLLAKGIPFAEIGSILSISPHTVTAHIKKIYRKLQVHSRGEAVYEASCMGLLSDI